MKEALHGNQVKNGCVQMDVLHGESEPITPGPIQLATYVCSCRPYLPTHDMLISK